VSTSSSTTAGRRRGLGEVVDQLAERGVTVEELEDQRRGRVQEDELGGAADDDLLAPMVAISSRAPTGPRT